MSGDFEDEELTGTGFTGTDLSAVGEAPESTQLSKVGSAPKANGTDKPSDDEDDPSPALPDTGTFDLARALAAAQGALSRANGEVEITRTNGPAARISLEPGETLIGRDPGCDIVVDEREVSRRHAKVGRGKGGMFELVDLKSKNGTRVAGRSIRRITLLDGDSFEVGQTRFTLHITEESE